MPTPAFDPYVPFGTEPRALRETYLELYEEAIARAYPEMDTFLEDKSHRIDIDWMNGLALHTQVVVKQSALNFQHGRMLYALLRERADELPQDTGLVVMETGTARGFSALCMARALMDAGRSGHVVTSDLIPHHHDMIWNCIDDLDGPRSRHELLAPWSEERDRVVFLSGDTKDSMERLGLGRVHFAFLDGAHHEEPLMGEYRYVADRQQKGDRIVFDDVTPGQFDGIVRAIARIEDEGAYDIERFMLENRRGYAIARRR
ncbi:class I SAM-dependent methyltransferase [Roseobacter sp. HKCCA0434]|uniref:class I SAM-dependent methyltransferase n=1 Tax=Roseobacter sp. HKCCA0434 TaxID=3079297 RepID=UPI00290585AC|nr:class I SAM-dependent methyltransferase [Roseobacter sp. HKCCA0434]